MVLVRMSSRRISYLLVLCGSVLLSIAAGLVYLPAGIAVAGLAMVLSGLLLIDVEGARESSPARPLSRR
jgi:hypothetical protein